MGVAQIAGALQLPSMLVEQLVGQLKDCGMISAIQSTNINGATYQPARDIHTITIASVLEALDKRGQQEQVVEQSQDFASLSQAVDEVRDEMKRSPANRLVKDI